MNDDEDERTVWIGNLSPKVTEEILYELFLQAAPLQKVRIPKDKDGKQCGYGFITFKHKVSVPYATELLNGIDLFNKTLNVKPRNSNSHQNQNNAVQQLRFPQSLGGINASMSPNTNPNKNSQYHGVGSPKGWRDNSNYAERRRFNDSPYSRPLGDNHYNRNHYDRHSDRFGSNDRKWRHRH